MSETMLQRGVHKAVGPIRTGEPETEERIDVSATEQKRTLLIFKHADATPTVTCSHAHALSGRPSRTVRVVRWEAFFLLLFLRDDGEAQRGTLLPFKVKETNAHVSRAN